MMKRHVLRSTTLCMIALVLSACGGSSGGGPGQTTAVITVTEDAWANPTTLFPNGGIHFMGDNAANEATRGLLRFPLATVPAGANVVGAYLNLSYLNRAGTPGGAGNLGDLEFHRISGAAPLAAASYGATSLAHDPANNLADDLPNQRPRSDILALVQSALAAGDTHLTIRMQYEMLTDGGGDLDEMEWAAVGHTTEPPAVLEVVFTLP